MGIPCGSIYWVRLGPDADAMTTTTPNRVFELSWEVCNKVGGINTVIKSKAALMVECYPDAFTMIGPYFEQKAQVELDEKPVPPRYKKIFSKLKDKGIICHYGTWSIHGEPEAILIDFQGFVEQKNELKKKYWDEYGVDSLYAHWEFEEPMLFATAAGMLIEEYAKENSGSIVAHCHEWMAGFTLLYLKSAKSNVATVFTTHATMLGRALAGSGRKLYADLETLDPTKAAYEVGVQDKHTAERACAAMCDVFTTVSEITGIEAEKILGRRPEVLLFNGMSVDAFPTVEETSIKHAASRDKIKEFIAYYFYPYYSFDLQHTLVYFITARYEFRNKGLDVFIHALKKLNEELKKSNPERTIVVLFWIPLGTAGVKRTLIENKNAYWHIKNYVDWHAHTILKQLTFDFLIAGSHDEKQGLAEIFTQDFMRELRKDLQQFKRTGNPPISTHEILDEGHNELYQGLLAAGLDNKEEDRVKVIMYPAYLDGADSLLNIPYYEAIVGTHLGVFPSYYEPWGYTPLEAAALAVPAITTDLAGFGRFVQQHPHAKGIFVLSRFQKQWEEEVEELFRLLYQYSELDHVERVEQRLAAKTFAALADWKHFVKHYTRAHTLAIENAKK